MANKNVDDVTVYIWFIQPRIKMFKIYAMRKKNNSTCTKFNNDKKSK